MSQNFADLILGADTTGLLKGKKALEDTTKAGAATEKAVGGTEKGFVRAGRGAGAAAPKVDAFNKASERARGIALAAGKALAGMAVGYASFQAAGAAITMARDFNAALAETSTLIEGTPQQLDAITASARGMSKEFGGSATAQVQAFYQALSAGADSVETAAATLDAANRLAIGGATDVTTATGILSGVINSYGKEAISATQVSDALFVGMKTGVTTVGELSASLGGVIPTAKSLGISFDEVVAATAALTKNNLTTSAAVTSLNAALVGVIKPTKQASDLAATLGIEFNAAGLKAQGLAGFLADVVEKTGGNVDSMSQLFGSVEALKAALLFAGEAGGQYADILVQMDAKTGMTQEAFDKMSASLDQRWNVAITAATDIGLVLGNALLTVIVPAIEAAAYVVTTLADNADVLGIALGALALSRIPALLMGLNSVSISLIAARAAMVTSTGAAVALGAAMNLIPFVAVVTAVTAVVRLAGAMKDAKAAAADMSAAMGDSIAAMARLDGASNAYYSNITRGNYMAAKAAADFNKVQAEGAVQVAKIHLAAKERVSNMLYLGLAETQGVKNAKAALAELSGVYIEADATASAFDYSIEKMNLLFGETLPIVNDLADATAKYTASSFAAIPAISELVAKYGGMATSVRDIMQAQNDLAAADASAGFTKMLAGISGVTEKLGLGVDQAGDFQQALANISAMDTFNGQARAMASLAAHLLDASGGLENMNAEARAAYQSLLDAARSAADVAANASTASSNIGGAAGEAARLAQNLSAAASALAGVISATANLNVGAIGLEAQNRALESGNTLIQARTAGLVAAKKAELASALGSSEGVIRAAATAELNNYTAAVERSSSAQEVNERLTKAMTASLGGGGGGGGGGLSKATKDAAKELEKMADEIERLEFDADPLKKYTSEVANLDQLVGAGLSDGAYEKAVKDLNEEFANSNPTISAFGDAIGDFVAGGMRNFGDLLDSFKNMIKQMIATAVANPIKLALTTALTGGGATAAAAGQVAAPAGGLGSLGGILGGVSTFASGVVSGGMGLITSLTGAGGGLASAGTYLSSVLGSATTGIGAFGAAVGAIALPIAAVAAVFSFFKSKTKELDAGLRVTIDGMDTLVETFSTIEKKKFWGLSKKVSTSFQAAEDSVADPFEAIVAQMQGNVLAAAGSLGVGSDAFASFAHEITLSTKDMSEEEAQQAVAEALAGVGNAFAALTPDLEQFARDGEEAGDTLTRLVSDLGAVNLIMDTLGHTLQDVSVIGAGTASNFAAMFGGIEAMNTATTAFLSGFHSEAERFATAQRQIGAQFASLNIAMPQSRAEFRRMVGALDLTTMGGRETYAALVSLSGALDAVLPSVANFTAQIAEMAGSITTQIDAIIGDTSNAMRANEQAASLWYRTANTLRDFIADLRGTASALISGGQARAFSEMRFQTLLASAISGDNDAAGDLTVAARTLLDNTRATASSSLELARAEARVLSDLQLVSGVSDVEGARHDVVAGLLGQQVELLGSVRGAINSGNPLTAGDLDSLSGQLGALEGAIKAAEMINYAFLKERLSVSVDLIASANIPAALRTMLDNAATGITANIDYIVRADGLTPDLRWLALNSVSEHVKTVSFVAGGNLDAATMAVASATVSTLTKTINLFAGSALSSDVMRVALAGSSELSRTVNVAMASGASQDAIRIALGNVGTYAVIVSAALRSGLPDDVTRIITAQQGTYAAVIGAAISANISDAAKRILLDQQGGYIARVGMIFAANTTQQVKDLLLNGNTAAVRAVTILGAFAASTTPAQRALLIAQTQKINKTIDGHLALVGFDKDKLDMLRATTKTVSKGLQGHAALIGFDKDKLDMLRARTETIDKGLQGHIALIGFSDDKLDMLRARTETINKTISGAVDLSKLDATQSRFFAAINGTTDGKITLGGSFVFDPASGFSAWFASTTQAQIAAPMGSLRASLDALADLMRGEERKASLNSFASSLVGAGNGQFIATDPQIRQAAGIAGVDATGSVADVAARVSAFSGSDSISKLGVYNQDMVDFLISQIKTQGLRVNPSEYRKAFPGLSQSVETDPQRHFERFTRDNGDAAIRFKPRLFDWSSIGLNIPGFAAGGTHTGGLRMVGEDGPEIEYTGRSHISSNSQTRNMMNFDGVIKELRELRQEVAEARKQSHSIGKSVISANMRTADVLEKFDVDGLPRERT
jgi:TP901 family phage tail tape measure protein